MATRRVIRSPKRAFKRRAPLRTTAVKDTKWNTSRFVHVEQFVFDFEASFSRDIVIMNPRLLMEVTTQPTAQGAGLLQNMGPVWNQINSLRGVKVGGLVWDSGFVVQRPVTDEENAYVVAHARVHETLWSLETDHDTGLPTGIPAIGDTWRPLRIDDSVFVPGEDDEGLVRIHHTRMALLNAGNNAYGGGGNFPVSDASASGSPGANTWTMPAWGGTRSLRLRKFITDEQSLSFNLHVVNPNPASTDQFACTWVIGATVYWAMQNQR